VAVVLTAIEREIIECDDCVVFDPDRRPWKRRLKRGWDPIVWLIHNGRSRESDDATMHQQVVACRRHEDALIERGGWDGTGVRQK
jgi:hypothetical protein